MPEAEIGRSEARRVSTATAKTAWLHVSECVCVESVCLQLVAINVGGLDILGTELDHGIIWFTIDARRPKAVFLHSSRVLSPTRDLLAACAPVHHLQPVRARYGG